MTRISSNYHICCHSKKGTTFTVMQNILLKAIPSQCFLSQFFARKFLCAFFSARNSKVATLKKKSFRIRPSLNEVRSRMMRHQSWKLPQDIRTMNSIMVKTFRSIHHMDYLWSHTHKKDQQPLFVFYTS